MYHTQNQMCASLWYLEHSLNWMSVGWPDELFLLFQNCYVLGLNAV
jgi:hypothetical protein